MPFLGVQPSRGLGDVQVSTFSGNASTTAFTLPVAATTNGAAVHISGVRQVPTTDFAISSTTLTFTTAPPTGSSNIMVAYTKPATLSVPADDSVTSAKIGDDQIDSEHYVNGSIDTAHIADDQITLAKIASGTDGELITWDASGNPAAVGAGTSGHYLKSQGAGSVPVFAAVSAGFTIGTEQATTSGTTVTFGSIPAGTKMIIMNLHGVSQTSGDNYWGVRLGDAGGIETSGYVSESVGDSGSMATATNRLAFGDNVVSSGDASGQMILTLQDASNYTWCETFTIRTTTSELYNGAGVKSLSAELTQVQLYLSAGTFDAGAVNILYM